MGWSPRAVLPTMIIVLFADRGQCGVLNSQPPAPGYPGKVPSVRVLQDDICYHWRVGVWPWWLSPEQLPLRKSYEKKFLYSNGDRLCNGDIEIYCRDFQQVVLNPEKCREHYELCWYAKYGSWKRQAANREERVARDILVKTSLYRNGRRISQYDVERLCPNYALMDCKSCIVLIGTDAGSAVGSRPRRSREDVLNKCPKYFDRTYEKCYCPNYVGPTGHVPKPFATLAPRAENEKHKRERERELVDEKYLLDIYTADESYDTFEDEN